MCWLSKIAAVLGQVFCSGGCHANAVSANGDIYKPDHFSCELLKTPRVQYLYPSLSSALEEADVQFEAL